jgi:hypothetical protein
MFQRVNRCADVWEKAQIYCAVSQLAVINFLFLIMLFNEEGIWALEGWGNMGAESTT